MKWLQQSRYIHVPESVNIRDNEKSGLEEVTPQLGLVPVKTSNASFSE